MPLVFETQPWRDGHFNDEQLAVVNSLGAMGGAISLGITRVDESNLDQFMSRIRFFERFCNFNNMMTDDGPVPWPIPREVIESMLPIVTNVSPLTKAQFIKRVVDTYGEVT